MIAWIEKHTGWSALAAIAIAGVAGYFRLTQLGQQILIDDEWHAIHALLRLDYQQIFLSFGHADHSIPFTLLFKWLAETIGLSEWWMRVWPLLGGLATVALVPVLLRPWLRGAEPWLVAVLLAISPILIHFSRYVRPYALTVPLTFAAVIALWRWWHEGDRRWAVVFVPSAVLAGWMHPLTLLFTGGALLWFGLVALKDLLKHRDMAGLIKVVPVGLITVALSSVLVLPPLLADPHSMAAKTGIDELQWETVVWAWELVVGTAHWGMASLMVVLALVGWVVALRRDAWFVGYWFFITALAAVVLSLLNPAWVHHALVPVRYLSVAIPMVFALIAMGFVATLTWLNQFNPRYVSVSVTAVALALWLAGLVASGPLLVTYGQLNQFAGAARYHHDYDFGRNAYVLKLEQIELPPIYETMAETPGEWVLIESPWSFESHITPLVHFQRIHQMPIVIGMMTGLCVERFYGEFPHNDPHRRWLFKNFVHLADLPQALSDRNRFVVLNTQSVYPDIPLPGELVGQMPGGIQGCVDHFANVWGEPWYQDEYRVIYRLPAESG